MAPPLPAASQPSKATITERLRLARLELGLEDCELQLGQLLLVGLLVVDGGVVVELVQDPHDVMLHLRRALATRISARRDRRRPAPRRRGHRRALAVAATASTRRRRRGCACCRPRSTSSCRRWRGACSRPTRRDAPSADAVDVARRRRRLRGQAAAPVVRDVRALLQLVEHGSSLFRGGTTRFTHLRPASRTRCSPTGSARR